MKLINVPNCLDKNIVGKIKFADIQDPFFDTDGSWTYKVDTQSGHLWLDPRPDDSSIGKLYAKYYTHSDVKTVESKTLWEMAVAVALERRLGYVISTQTSLLTKIVSLMPTVASAAELEMMRIPASKKGRILDVGCGDGAFLRRMKIAGWSVTGTEPDEKAAARLQLQAGFSVFRSLQDVLENPGMRFDIIVLSHVIEHLPDPVKTLTQLHHLLNKGGQLIITTPNAASLGARIFGKYWRGLEPPRHFNIFTTLSLQQLLKNTGFKVDILKTEFRLARGIFFMSLYAAMGGNNLELDQRPKSHFIKYLGYFFQLVEAMLGSLKPSYGEEIFCSASQQD